MIRQAIQRIIKEACEEVYSDPELTRLLNDSSSNKTKQIHLEEIGDIFFIKKIESLLSTINLFIDQDSKFNALMNLNVNFRRVRQENFTEKEEKNFKSAIFQEGGTSFQNSPIHLMFYEKLDIFGKDLLPTDEKFEELELSSMSYCRLRKDFASKLSETAVDTEIRLVQQGVSACFF